MKNSMIVGKFTSEFRSAENPLNRYGPSSFSFALLYVAPIGAFFCTGVSPIDGHQRLLTAIFVFE